jgi:hypothetical protein
MKPSLGRIVIFRGPGIGSADEAPAIITAVHAREFVSLTVFPPGTNPFPVSDVPFDAGAETPGNELRENAWRWPPRV